MTIIHMQKTKSTYHVSSAATSGRLNISAAFALLFVGIGSPAGV